LAQRLRSEQYFAELKNQADEKREQAAIQAQKEAEKRQALRAKFTSDFRVQEWVTFDSLTINPFAYQNKVVGIKEGVKFNQMISPSMGLFGHHAQDHLRQAVAAFSRRPAPMKRP
jgi:hypothetical protein